MCLSFYRKNVTGFLANPTTSKIEEKKEYK